MPIFLKQINKELASQIVEYHHYLHKRPSNISIAYGAYPDENKDTLMQGVIIFSQPVSRFTSSFVKTTLPYQVLELTRLWLHDDMPKNSESQVISTAIRLLKRDHKEIKWLISYADPNYNHAGTIYQATNWTYIGQPSKKITEYMIDGKTFHKKTMGDRYHSAKNIFETFKDFNPHYVSKEGKYCYLYFLDESYKPKLLKEPKPYPKLKADLVQM
jgi:hypothetical protein